MKGIIQMTILEPLVHLYQKLRRCCWHNNVKIFFPLLLFYLGGSDGMFPPSQFHSFMAVISSSLHSDTRGDAQTIEQTTPVGDAETAAWKLTWELLTVERGGGENPHTTLNLPCLKRLCNCTRREPRMARPRISSGGGLDWRRASQVWRRLSERKH